MTEYKELEKEKNKIWNKIEELLQNSISTIDDDYSDIIENIGLLIDVEIEMEKFCNQ